MKSQRSLYLFVYLSLFLFLIGSCVNDLDTELSGPVPASGKMDVTQAKSFFDSSGGKVAFPVMSLPSEGVQNKSLTSVVSPQWDNYRQINAESYQAIQVPLDDGNHYAARTYSMDSLGRANMEKSSWQSYLVVARSGQNNRVRSFVATLIPSRDYHERKSGWKSVINFAPEGSDFTGMVLYSSLEGQFYSGTTFREGRVVGRIQSEQCDSTQCAGDGSCEACHKPSVGLKHLVLCLYGPEDLVLNRAICPESGMVYDENYGVCPGCGRVHLFVVETTTSRIYYCWGCLANLSAGEACQCCHYCWSPPGGHEQWCLYYEGEGEDGGEYEGDPEGGSGGGGGGGGFSPSSSTPNAYRVFRGNLSVSQWKILEDWVKEMRKTCLGNTVYSQAAIHNTIYNISFTTGRGSSFSASGEQMSIVLGEDTYSGAAFHEMFHGYVYQQPRNGAGAANEEIEAYYAQYIYDLSRQNSGSMAKYGNNGRFSFILELDQYIDSQGDLREGVTEGDLASFHGGEALYQLRTLGYSESSYPYVTMLVSTNNFSYLKSISTNLLCQ